MINVHYRIITTRLTEQFLEFTSEQAHEAFLQKAEQGALKKTHFHKEVFISIYNYPKSFIFISNPNPCECTTYTHIPDCSVFQNGQQPPASVF